MPHIVSADLARAVGETVREHRRMQSSESSRGLSKALPATQTTRAFCICKFPSASKYSTPVDLALVVIVQNARDMRISAAPRGCLSLRLSECRHSPPTTSRPICSPGNRTRFAGTAVATVVSVVAELIAIRPVWTFFISKRLRALLEDRDSCCSRAVPSTVAGSGDAELVLRLRVPRVHLGARRLASQAGDAPCTVSIGRRGFPLMVLEAQGGAGPVLRGAADGFHDPGRQDRRKSLATRQSPLTSCAGRARRAGRSSPTRR